MAGVGRSARTTAAASVATGFNGLGPAPATSLKLRAPRGIAVVGNTLFIVDNGNYLVRMVDEGAMSTLLGSAPPKFYNGSNPGMTITVPVGGLAVENPFSLIPDWPPTNKSFLLSDISRIFRVHVANRSGTTLAGLAGGSTMRGNSGDGGPATLAKINAYPYVQNIAWDAEGNLLLADTFFRVIRSISPGGIITTLQIPVTTKSAERVVSSEKMVQASTSGLVLSAAVGQRGSGGIATGASGAVAFADSRNVINLVDADGALRTLAGILNVGVGAGGYSGDNGPAIKAQLNGASDVVFAGNGSIVIADTSNNVLRAVSAEGVITTIAGNVSRAAGYSGDGGLATSSALSAPSRLAWSASSNAIYVTDFDNTVIRRIRDGIITTIAGNTSKGYFGDGGLAIKATFFFSFGLGQSVR